MEKNNLREHIKRAVDELPSDLKAVLFFRYGLVDGRKQSIGEAAKNLNAKTSQVAAIELKAIRCLRKPALCAPFFKILDEMDPLIWHEIAEEISDAGSLIRKNENFDMAMEALPGEISLAIKCRYSNLVACIASNSFEVENTWFRSKYSHETVKDKVRKLNEIRREKTSPFFVAHLTAELEVDVSFLRFILALSPQVWGFYGGYVAERPLPSPALRAIRMHLSLLYQYTEATVGPDQIVKGYNTLYHDDQLTGHLADTIMRSRPRLFLEADDQGWSALGSIREHMSYAEVDDVESDNLDAVHADEKRKKTPFVYERPWSETTASQIIQEILEQSDFCRRKSILKGLVERTNGRYDHGSALPVLSSHEDIQEVAPGVYGLREVCKNIDPLNTWSEILLTRRACKSFMLERYAGEPLNGYPLWTSAMEQQWCLWAEKNSELNFGMGFGGDSDRAFSRKLYQSLLFVSEPDHWPVSDVIKTQWRFKKQALSTYHFVKPVPDHLWGRVPSLQDLFSVAMASEQIDYTNWIRISYALALGRHSLNGVGAMVLLIALEMILPAENWQRRHEMGPQKDSLLSIMIKEIRKKGFVHWMDETGAYVKDRLRKSINRVQLGWVSADWIREFLDVLEGTGNPEQAIGKSPSQTTTKTSIQNDSARENRMESPEQLTLF